MAATRKDIDEWFERGLKEGATHLIVICDTFDWDDYPVFVLTTQKVREEIKKRDQVNMQKLMEVYNLAKPKEPQLDEVMAYNL